MKTYRTPRRFHAEVELKGRDRNREDPRNSVSALTPRDIEGEVKGKSKVRETELPGRLKLEAYSAVMQPKRPSAEEGACSETARCRYEIRVNPIFFPPTRVRVH